jgi:hypothetical protein
MPTYQLISPHNDRLHGRLFDSVEDACAAVGSTVIDSDCVDLDSYGRICGAVGIYATEADRDANDEGDAPHLRLAFVRVIEVD